MSIYNKTWTADEEITYSKLNQVTADAVNKIDNIHPQFMSVLPAQPLQAWIKFEYAAAAGQNFIDARALINTGAGGVNGISFGIASGTTEAGVPGWPIGGALATYFSLLSVQFPKKMLENSGYEVSSISTYFLEKNIPGAGFSLARSDLKFRSVVFEYGVDYALLSTTAQTDQGGANDSNWHAYHSTDIDVSGLVSTSLIVVDFQVRMSTDLTAAANDAIQAFIAFAHIDFLNR
jgi:hypothetical protein